MTILVHTCRATLIALLIPLAGALLVCVTILKSQPPEPALGSDHSVGLWLHVPGILLCAAALAAGLEHWPLFSRDRPGAPVVRRVVNRGLHGCAAAGIGALLALTVALAAAGVAFTLLMRVCDHDGGPAHARIGFVGGDGSILGPNTPTRRLRATSAAAIARLELRPTALFGGDSRPAQLRLEADGRALHPGWLSFHGDPIALDLTAPCTIRELTIHRRREAGLMLHLAVDRATGIAARGRSAIVNGVLALLTYLLPTMLAIGVMTLGHRFLALPVNLAAGLGTLLLVTVTDLTPNSVAITAFARGYWVATEPLALGSTIAAAATVAALLLALMMPRTERSRAPR